MADSVGLTILGGAIAAAAGLSVEWWKDLRRLSRTREVITTAIRDDLSNVDAIYDRIIEEWNRTRIVWFATTGEFGASRQAYLKNSDWTVVLTDPALRRDIVSYYQRSFQVVSMLETAQRRKYELQAKLNELTRAMQLQGHEYAAAQAAAAAMMVPESQELQYIEQALPESIDRTRDMRNEAAALLRRLPD